MSGLRIVALGRPVPQGSLTSMGPRRPLLASNRQALTPWRTTVAVAAARAADLATWNRTTGPVTVEVTFFFDRPATHYGTGRNAQQLRASAPQFPATRGQGDLDKLLRSCFDAITDSGSVWADDSQVAHVMAGKRWTSPAFPHLDRPGMTAVIRPLATTVRSTT